MKFTRLFLSSALLAIFSTTTYANWEFPTFNKKPDSLIQLELEQEKINMIEICKNSIFNLHKESVDYPKEFIFSVPKLTENIQEKTINISIDYTAIKIEESIPFNMKCDFSQNSYQDSIAKYNIWHFTRETFSY